MNTEAKTALIIGATAGGLIAAKTIVDLFESVIIVEQGSEQSLSQRAMQHVRTLSYQAGIQVLFNCRVRGLLMNTAGHISGANVQDARRGMLSLSADVVIDASDLQSRTPLWLKCSGYGAVPYTEKQIVISAPRTQTVMIQSYQYHKMPALPEGLFVIGQAVSNIGQLAGQEDRLANVQAIILKQYLDTKKGNIQFQKNIAWIISIVINEYIYLAKQNMQLERQLQTRPALASN